VLISLSGTFGTGLMTVFCALTLLIRFCAMRPVKTAPEMSSGMVSLPYLLMPNCWIVNRHSNDALAPILWSRSVISAVVWMRATEAEISAA